MTNTCPTERGPDATVVVVGTAAVEGVEVPDDDEDEHAARASATAHETTRSGFPTGEACPPSPAGRNAPFVPPLLAWVASVGRMPRIRRTRAWNTDASAGPLCVSAHCAWAR